MDKAQQEKYTVAFVFNEDLTKVLLVHKLLPEWQRGKLNGIGGKYEPGETGLQCIRRETREESSLDIAESSWVRIGTMTLSSGNVGVYVARYDGDPSNAVKSHHEEVEWFAIRDIPGNVIPNLRWLIPLAHTKLSGADSFLDFRVDY